jgi:N-acetyl-D-muramate 6-phosphate phosphatase
MTRPRTVVLFDLDGTLIDSAPDLAGAANDMRIARGLPALPLATLRKMVGSGARGMVGTAFELAPGDEAYETLRTEFLERYEGRMTRETEVFPAVVGMLERLQSRGIAWGIVTNKAARYAEPIVAALGLDARAATLVCGDTTPHAKPHPAPLLEAARRVGVEPADCVYVGDDLRDVQAGRAAGMATVAVAWGYLGAGEPIGAWGADHVIEEPGQLLTLLPVA